MGALVSALTGSAPPEVAVWAGATGLSAAAAVAFAAAQQGVERHRLTHATTYVFGLLALAALVAVVGVSAGWFTLGLSDSLGLELGVIVSAFALAVLAASAVLAQRRLGRIRRARLTSGGALVSGISGAFFALDIGLARDIVVERRAMERGHVKPRRGRGVGLEALVWRELQRLVRFPQPLLVLIGTIVVPYAAVALGMGVLTSVFAALALFGATIPLLGGLRVLTRTGGLARCLPFSLARIKLASIAVPASLALAWAVAVVPAFLEVTAEQPSRVAADGVTAAIATAAAGLLAAVRWTQAKGVDFGAPMISSQAGAFPPGLVTNLFRGFDVCLLPPRRWCSASPRCGRWPSPPSPRRCCSTPSTRRRCGPGRPSSSASWRRRRRSGRPRCSPTSRRSAEAAVYSTVNWIWCQPVAPRGNTLVRCSGWVAPVRSVARTWVLSRTQFAPTGRPRLVGARAWSIVIP